MKQPGPCVVVIDSGLNTVHPHLVGARIIEKGIRVAEHHPTRLEQVTGDTNGHGTAVAAMIFGLAPSATLVSIQILDHQLRAHHTTLVEALQWASEFRPNIVNLSVGTTDSAARAEVEAATNSLLREEVIVVAARHPREVQSWPATVRGVVTVQASAQLRLGEVRACGAPLEYLGHGEARPPRRGIAAPSNFSGSSLAAATMTGLLAQTFTSPQPRSLQERLAAVEAKRMPKLA